ncbi:MAG: DUF2950 family protein [Planctomycetota bacterium]
MTRAAVLLLAAAVLLAEDPPAIEWNKDTVTPSCPACTAELPLECETCPGCGERVTWRDLQFDQTPAGAFVQLKYALKYHRPDLLQECVTTDVYKAAEAEQFAVDSGPLQMFLKARIKKVEKDGDLARIQFEAGEGEEARLFTFEARREAEGWRLGPPTGKMGVDASANESLALRDLLEIAEAERRWLADDPEGNRQKDYWTRDVAGLCAHPVSTGGKAGLVREDLARADRLGVGHYPDLGEARATHGYWFQMLRRDALEQRYQLDVDRDGAPFENGSDFGVVAWPEEYGESGKRTFILSSRGQVWARDLGSATSKDPPRELSEGERIAADRLLEGLLSARLEERGEAAERILDLGTPAHGWLREAMSRDEFRSVRGTMKLLVEAIEPPPCALERFPGDPESDGWTLVPMGQGPR